MKASVGVSAAIWVVKAVRVVASDGYLVQVTPIPKKEEILQREAEARVVL